MNILKKFPARCFAAQLLQGQNRRNFYEKDPKSGYRNTDRKLPPTTQLIRDGFKELKQEIALWTKEVKQHFEDDPLMFYRSGETDILWEFKEESSLDRWVVTSDSDNNEGHSRCSLMLNKHGNGLFSGNLCTTVPKDGRIKRSGYCNMRTVQARKSFKRECYLDWTCYNMLVMKVRGDGRSYMLNISSKGYYDILWNDSYHFILYTRGGPYWQLSKIPFSKFFLGSKGRIQDKQHPLPLDRVTNFGISCMDKIDGPFQLEIEYVGLEYDPNHTEEFAYEMYEVPQKFLIGP